MAGFDDCSQQFLFRPIFRSGNICNLIYKNKQLSYTAARGNIISRLKLISGNLNIGLHSSRSEGATAIANSDVDNSCWKGHGGGKRTRAKVVYIIESVEKRLKISQTLRLWFSVSFFTILLPSLCVFYWALRAVDKNSLFFVVFFKWNK